MKTKRALFSLIALIFTVCLLVILICKYLNVKDGKSSLKANALTLNESADNDQVMYKATDSNNDNIKDNGIVNDSSNIKDNGISKDIDNVEDIDISKDIDNVEDNGISKDIDEVKDIDNAEDIDNIEDNAIENDNDHLIQERLSSATNDLEEEKSKYSNIGISIANSYLNIREKATTESNVLGKLYRDSVARIINTEGDWYYIESGSVKGYVSSDYIKTGLTDDELIKKYGSQYIQVKCNGLNVREEPDTESKRRTVIYLDETYPVVELLEDWVKINIEDDNVIGYVSREYVDLIIDFPQAISKEEEAELQRLEEEKKRKKETSIKYGDEVKYTQEELKLLACLVHAEAGNQSYEGKLAVANVVLNRVKSKKYPNSIKEVIYQAGQFAVATSGSLEKQLAKYDNYNSTSQKLSIKAAKAALEGANNIKARLYFNSYKSAVKKGYGDKPNAVKIGDQLFW